MRAGRWLLLFVVCPGLVGWRWPGEVNRLCQRAKVAFEGGDPTEAAALFREALGGSAKPELSYNLGSAQLAARDYAGAAETLGRGLEQTSDPAMLNRMHYNRGNSLFRLQQIPAAASAYEAALQADPTDEDARYNLELCRELMRQQEQQNQDQQNQDQQNQDGQGEQNPQNSGQGENQGSPSSQPPGSEGQPRDGNLLGLTEEQVDRLLRDFEKDERQLRPYFNPRETEPDGAFAELDRRLRELTGDSTERDW